MVREKLIIQKIQQRLDSLIEKIHSLEDSKFMCNRLKCSEFKKEYKVLQDKLITIKTN